MRPKPVGSANKDLVHLIMRIERTCYCGETEGHRNLRAKLRIPDGFCGVCSICGEPGHTSHSPLPIPATEGFCDICFEKLGVDFELWREENPTGYVSEFMKQWRERNPVLKKKNRSWISRLLCREDW